jgi:hypothetical protein
LLAATRVATFSVVALLAVGVLLTAVYTALVRPSRRGSDAQTGEQTSQRQQRGAEQLSSGTPSHHGSSQQSPQTASTSHEIATPRETKPRSPPLLKN